MRVGIVGSRKWAEEKYVRDFIYGLESDTVVVTGDCPSGADAMAQRFGKERGLPVVVHYADWKNLGKAAGPLRNTEIVKDCDYVVAFYDGTSKGTMDTLKKAKSLGKKFYVVLPKGFVGDTGNITALI